MNLTLTNDNRANGLQDGLKSRLIVGFAASLVLNFVLWRTAAAIAKHPPAFVPRPVEITRVVLDNRGHKTEKVVTKHDIQKKVHKDIARRKPVVLPIPKPTPRPPVSHPARIEPVKPPEPIKQSAPPPETAHSKILTAPLDKNAAPNPDDQTALKGGNAPIGKAIDQQNPGNGTNPAVAIKDPPKDPPKIEPKVETKVEAPPVKVDPPKREIVAPPVEPVKPDPPKPKGPSREAQPENQSNPEIPDALKHGDFKSFVRVKVEIDADGSFTPLLRTSSGNTDIDNRVLEALKKWKWKPALKDGIPVKSVQLFKFEFEVQ